MMIVMKGTATEDEIQAVISRIESCGARKTKKKPGNLISVAVAALPHLFCVINFLFFCPLLLLLGLFQFIARVSDALRLRVNLLQFHFR